MNSWDKPDALLLYVNGHLVDQVMEGDMQVSIWEEFSYEATETLHNVRLEIVALEIGYGPSNYRIDNLQIA